MTIEDRLIEWDGKSMDFLTESYHRFCGEPGFIDDLVLLIEVPELQAASTWLLKHHLDAGNTIATHQRSSIVRGMRKLDEWEAKLHVLQCLPHFKLNKTQAATTMSFLRSCLDDKNKFVRAWSFGGLHLVAEQFPQYRGEARERLAWASEHEAPSVRARIRRVLGSK